MDEYSLFAVFYDLLLTPFLSGMRKVILRIALEKRPDNVVDLCGGTGHQMKLLKRAGFRNLYCVDLSEQMLSRAASGPHAPYCLLRDAVSTGFNPDSADMVVISLALHEKPPEKAAGVIAEAGRILRSGGILVAADYSCSGAPFYARAVIRFIERLAGGEHYASYRKYMKSGGLPALIDYAVFEPLAEYRAASGGITIRISKKR